MSLEAMYDLSVHKHNLCLAYISWYAHSVVIDNV